MGFGLAKPMEWAPCKVFVGRVTLGENKGMHAMKRECHGSGKPWEAVAGYSRVIRVGNHVHVTGTVAANDKGEALFPGDPGAQAEHILAMIETYLAKVGAAMHHVVRTRIYVTDITQWEAVGSAHGKRFSQIRPVTTMVEVSGLIGPDFTVEIEAEAIIHDAAELA